MCKVKILFFSADPLSAPDGRNPRLRLDEDMRQIRQKVRAAEHRDALEFDFRHAATADDLLQALNETHPQVVHFSGHGESGGLVLAADDGQSPHRVEPAALAQLFEVFRGDIRLVVLNACFSLPQAEAIAGIVGCAIATRSAISDDAAITFGAAFYRAIAFGHSVRAAFDQARTALALAHFDERDCPQLVARDDVDSASLILVPSSAPRAGEGEPGADPPSEPAPRPAAAWRGSAGDRYRALGVRRIGVAVAVLVLSSAAVVAGAELINREEGNPQASQPAEKPVGEVQPAEFAPAPLLAGGRPPPAVAPTGGIDPSNPVDELAAAKALHRAGHHAAAFPMFKRAAEAGNAEAMAFLGIAYLNGEGTAPQPDSAYLWLHEAADRRDPLGMTWLGVAYQRGVGVERSERWARHWYEAAAEEKGYAEAMRHLGSLCREDGSSAQALEWYQRAIHAGSLDAMVDLGRMYEDGLAGPGARKEALRWYHTAAQSGLPRGMYMMGWVYENGTGVPRDDQQAAAWYRQGAEAGSADAMNNLGVLYYEGRGVPRNRAEAIRWFRRAAAAGSAVAAGNLASRKGG